MVGSNDSMCIVLAIIIIISIYIYTFKEDFKEEDIGKVALLGIVSTIFIILLMGG